MKAYAVPFEKYVNLADARLGTKAISVTDDWFADVNRLFQPTPAVWKEGVFDDNGKWMDGRESRRKRFEGYGVLQGSCRVSRVFMPLFSVPVAPFLG